MAKNTAFPFDSALEARLIKLAEEYSKDMFNPTGHATGYTTGPVVPLDYKTILGIREKMLSNLPDDEWFLVRVPRGHQLVSIPPIGPMDNCNRYPEPVKEVNNDG